MNWQPTGPPASIAAKQASGTRVNHMDYLEYPKSVALDGRPITVMNATEEDAVVRAKAARAKGEVDKDAEQVVQLIIAEDADWRNTYRGARDDPHSRDPVR